LKKRTNVGQIAKFTWGAPIELVVVQPKVLCKSTTLE